MSNKKDVKAKRHIDVQSVPSISSAQNQKELIADPRHLNQENKFNTSNSGHHQSSTCNTVIACKETINKSTNNLNVKKVCYKKHEKTMNMSSKEAKENTHSDIIQMKFGGEASGLNENMKRKSNNKEKLPENFLLKKKMELSNNMKESKNKIVQNIYIVVDGDIMIRNVAILSKILEIRYSNDIHPIILVPWVVQQKIEYYIEKNYIELKENCYKARRFINDSLDLYKNRFKCQSHTHAAKHRKNSKTFHDFIINYCKDVANCHKIVLLTTDSILGSKIIAMNINCFTPDNLLVEFKRKKTSNLFDLIQEISLEPAGICSFVIDAELRENMREPLYSAQLLKSFPWHFRDCVYYMKEYYPLVFRLMLPSEIKEITNDLWKILNDYESSNETAFLELCISFLVCLKTGVTKYKRKVNHAIWLIKQIKMKRNV